MALSTEAARWFETRRGIRPDTLAAFGVETDSGGALVFPYGEARKYRKGFEKEEGRKFWWDPPGAAGQLPFLPPDFQPRERMILLEGETDTMAAWQAMPESLREKVGIVGLSGTNAWKGRYADELMSAAQRVFVVFDRDDPYENADAARATEKAWLGIKADLGRKARRVVLPQGINDVAEFFQRYDWAAFEALLKEAAAPKRHYPRLDLSEEPPPTPWLVEDLLVMEEATVMAADGGVGKSFIAMALALAVSGRQDKFLGLKVMRHGPVIYVDEENSRQLVLERMHALGYDPRKHHDLEYLWSAGVDLAREPGLLLEEALDIEPALIVIDSLSRVSIGVKENDNTEMTALVKDGVVPLARETGAAVLVIHHTPKGESDPRGAGSIKNAADQSISVVPALGKDGKPTGRLTLFPSKPRRRTTSLGIEIVGDMQHDGYVAVQAVAENDPTEVF